MGVTKVRAGTKVRNGGDRLRGWYGTWMRVGTMVAHVPWLRPVYRASDHLVFALWWWGNGYEGAYGWRWYRGLEDRFGVLYARVYVALWEVIYREIGE